jgi:hypothetical protein
MPVRYRRGLLGVAGAADHLEADAYNQLGSWVGGLADLLAELVGGPGILWGGALVLADWQDGATAYPVTGGLWEDDGGVLFYGVWSAAVVPTWLGSGSSYALYLVPDVRDMPDGPLGELGPVDWSLVGYGVGGAAPSYAYRLGTATRAGGVVTGWTPEAGVFVGPTAGRLLRRDRSGTVDGDLTVTGEVVVASGYVAGLWTVLNGHRQEVSSGYYGAPALDALQVGAWYSDRAGAAYEGVSVGGHVVATQRWAGRVAWADASALEVGSNWLGSARQDGYRVWIDDPAQGPYGGDWVWEADLVSGGCWVAVEPRQVTTVPVSGTVNAAAGVTWLGVTSLPGYLMCFLWGFSVVVYTLGTGGWAGGKRWDICLGRFGGSTWSPAAVVAATGRNYVDQALTGDDRLMAVGGLAEMYLEASPVNSPPTLDAVQAGSISWSRARAAW